MKAGHLSRFFGRNSCTMAALVLTTVFLWAGDKNPFFIHLLSSEERLRMYNSDLSVADFDSPALNSKKQHIEEYSHLQVVEDTEDDASIKHSDSAGEGITILRSPERKDENTMLGSSVNEQDKAFASRRQWYFFSRKMQNRTAENGFWKEIGVDETILTSTGNKVGIKKYLVFYDDDVRSENKTNWIMEEYRLLISPKGQNQIQDLDEWVLCRVHEANISSDGLNFPEGDGDGDGDELSYLDEVFLSLEDDQEEINFPY